MDRPPKTRPGHVVSRASTVPSGVTQVAFASTVFAAHDEIFQAAGPYRAHRAADIAAAASAPRHRSRGFSPSPVSAQPRPAIPVPAVGSPTPSIAAPRSGLTPRPPHPLLPSCRPGRTLL